MYNCDNPGSGFHEICSQVLQQYCFCYKSCDLFPYHSSGLPPFLQNHQCLSNDRRHSDMRCSYFLGSLSLDWQYSCFRSKTSYLWRRYKIDEKLFPFFWHTNYTHKRTRFLVSAKTLFEIELKNQINETVLHTTILCSCFILFLNKLSRSNKIYNFNGLLTLLLYVLYFISVSK